MSINVNTIANPPSLLTQVVTAVNASNNELASREVVFR